jgi:nucleoid-associated protein YgaU
MKRILLVLVIGGLAAFGAYQLAQRRAAERRSDAGRTAAAPAETAAKAPAEEAPAEEAKAEGAAPAETAKTEEKVPAKAPEKPVLLSMRAVAKTESKAPETAPAEVRAVVPAPDSEVGELIQKGQAAMDGGNKPAAWEHLSRAYWSGKREERAQLLGPLTALSRQLFWNVRSVDGATIYEVSGGDSLVRIGKKLGAHPMGIARVNGIVRAHLIKVGQKLRVFPGKADILVSKQDFTLTLFVGGRFVKQYRVGLGKENRTPVGTFEINNPLQKPDWYPPEGGIIKFGDKRNLLGTRWLGFKDKPGVTGFGIHGTWEPETVGTMASNGCIRMRNEDVEELFDFVLPGSRVVIEP